MVSTDHGRFWQSAAGAAGSVPATGAEAHSWIARNLAELAVMLEVTHTPVLVLDKAVRSHDLAQSDSRFLRRLNDLRLRRGPVPAFYPQCGTSAPRPVAEEQMSDLAAAKAVLNFAGCLSAGSDTSDSAGSSALGGIGAGAVAGRSAWRPLPTPEKPHAFLESDIPPSLLWRAWMVLPEHGVTRIVIDERLDESAMDVWWGVHDGTHLDHLACLDTEATTAIEFGSGLLAAEALAMSAEILAGAEALADGDVAVQATIRSGLIERVGRLPLEWKRSGAAASLAAQHDIGPSAEFCSLPTVARAYVAGPLRLIANGFRDRHIPPDVAERFADRWRLAATATSAAARLTSLAEEWLARYDR